MHTEFVHRIADQARAATARNEDTVHMLVLLERHELTVLVPGEARGVGVVDVHVDEPALGGRLLALALVVAAANAAASSCRACTNSTRSLCRLSAPMTPLIPSPG